MPTTQQHGHIQCLADLSAFGQKRPCMSMPRCRMQATPGRSFVVGAALLLLSPVASSAPPASFPRPVPLFEIAYQAWEVVTDLARRNADPAIGGECAKTFRPFVSPGLRMQTKQEQDVSSVSCVEAARSACANTKLRAAEETTKKCKNFR
jgi:hypothetical protein